MRYNIEHKDQTRQNILKEAAAAIRATGPDKVSVMGVMAKVGLTQGGFYAHFESKDDLVAKAIPVMFDDSYRRFLKDAEEVDPKAALVKFIDRYLSLRHRDNPAHGCPMPTLAGDLSRMPMQARENFQAGAQRLTHSIAKLIAQIQPEHADETAVSVVAEMVGALSIARAIDDKGKAEHILKASREALKRRLDLQGT